jgi:F-type H+-transporting ATPase subunit epsilon
MAGTFKFELVSPERLLMSEDVEQVVLPGSEGDFAVLVGHAPVIASLRPGVLDIQLPAGKRRVFVKGGFAEVDPRRLTVLAEVAIEAMAEESERIAREVAVAEAELAAATDDAARFAAGTTIDELRQLQRGGSRAA